MQTTTLTKDRPVLSLERTPHNNKTVTVKQHEPQMGARHQNWLTDWLTVSRNVTLTLDEIELRESFEIAVEEDLEEMARK
jgi:ABC-type nitrate/sulfonate/bicarbonate transport system ATPase subunit